MQTYQPGPLATVTTELTGAPSLPICGQAARDHGWDDLHAAYRDRPAG